MFEPALQDAGVSGEPVQENIDLPDGVSTEAPQTLSHAASPPKQKASADAFRALSARLRGAPTPAFEPETFQDFQAEEYDEFPPGTAVFDQAEEIGSGETFTPLDADVDDPHGASLQSPLDSELVAELQAVESIEAEQEIEIAEVEETQPVAADVAAVEPEVFTEVHVDAIEHVHHETHETGAGLGEELPEPAELLRESLETPGPQGQAVDAEDDFEINFAVEVPDEEVPSAPESVQALQFDSTEDETSAHLLEQIQPEIDRIQLEAGPETEASQDLEPIPDPGSCSEAVDTVDCQSPQTEQPTDQSSPPALNAGTVFEIDDEEDGIEGDAVVESGQEPVGASEAGAVPEYAEIAASELDTDSVETPCVGQPELLGDDQEDIEPHGAEVEVAPAGDEPVTQHSADQVAEELLQHEEPEEAAPELETGPACQDDEVEQEAIVEPEPDVPDLPVSEEQDAATEVISDPAVSEESEHSQPTESAATPDDELCDGDQDAGASDEAAEQQVVDEGSVVADEDTDNAPSICENEKSAEVVPDSDENPAQEFSQIMESLSEKFSPQRLEADTKTREKQATSDDVVAADDDVLEVEFDESTTDPEAGETARMLLDIMSKPSGAAQPQERALAADTLLRLVTKIPAINLISLSDRICIMESPPALLVNKLIRHPDARVAGPLLETCAAISDQVLLPVIRKADDEKRRMIARRNFLSQALCDELLEYGDSSVYLTVVRNPGASLSHDAFVILSERARSQPSLQAPLVTRGDTPAPTAFELFWFLPSELRRYVLSRFLTDSETLNKILKITLAVDGSMGSAGETETRFAESHRVAELCTLIEEGSSNRAAAVLSELAGINEANALRIISDPDGDPLSVAMKSLGVTRSVFSDALKRWQASPNCLIRAERPNTELQNLFDSLSFNKARVLLTYWDWAALESGPYARKAA